MFGLRLSWRWETRCVAPVLLALLVLSLPTVAAATNGNVFAQGVYYSATTYAGHGSAVDLNGASATSQYVDDYRWPLYAPENGSVSVHTEPIGGNTIWWTSANGSERLEMAHLDQIVKTGAVQAGDLIAYLGNSGTGSQGAHLHMQRVVNGADTSLVLGGVTIAPYTFPSAHIYQSGGPVSSAVRYNPIAPGDAGFSRYGTPAGWNNIGGGLYGSGIYTFSNGWTRDNYARWTFDLNQINGTRRYKVEAYVTSTHAGSTQAQYHINAANGVQYPTLNQNNLSNQWGDLGSYTLNTGSAWVELDDASGEVGGASAKEIAFDAIKLTPYFALNYTAGSGGAISGTSAQSVISGGAGTQVTAVANSGYHFVKWSDNGTSATRTDSGIASDRTLTATFASNAPTPTSITIRTNATSCGIGGIATLSGAVTPSSMIGKNIVVMVKKPGKSFYSYSSNRTAYSLNGGAVWQYRYGFKSGMTKGIYYFKAQAPAPGFASSSGYATSNSSVISIRLK